MEDVESTGVRGNVRAAREQRGGQTIAATLPGIKARRVQKNPMQTRRQVFPRGPSMAIPLLSSCFSK
jgi:hypothetical protein